MNCTIQRRQTSHCAEDFQGGVLQTLVVLSSSVLEFSRCCTSWHCPLASFRPETNVLVYSVGYPVATYFTSPLLSTHGGFNLGGTNASGQVSLAFSLQRVSWLKCHCPFSQGAGDDR